MPKCKPQSIQKGYYIVAKHDSDSYNCLEFRRNKSENTVDNGDIQKEEEKSPATKEKYLRSIRGFLNYAKDMPDADWQDGIIGAGSSNIAWGYSNLNGAIMGWMQDEDAYNISVLGHRRWMLNPKMGKTGFGASNSSGPYYEQYYAEYSFDMSGSGTQRNVAWTAPPICL